MRKESMVHNEESCTRKVLPTVTTVLQYTLCVCIISTTGDFASGAPASTILSQLRPYGQQTPRLPGLDPGKTLSQTNARLAREVLPVEVLQLLAAGDLDILIQETASLALRQSYVKATLQHSQAVSLATDGTLKNYQAGVPFPLLDPADPQAGQKLAWNVRYRDLGDTFEMQPNTQEVNASGQIEHYDRGLMRLRFGMHRPNPEDNDPHWQSRGIFMKTSFELLSPSDREGVMNIRTFYDADHQATEQWTYSPQTRRTRKTHVNYIAPIGGAYEALLEERPPFFFVGYLREYVWQFLGTHCLLVPGFLKATQLRFAGKHGWYPQIPWELRHVLVLGCTPRRSHPFGKRVFFLDQQTYTPLLILTYDPSGTFIRLIITAHAHPSFHPGSNGTHLPVLLGGTVINYLKNRATIFSTGDSARYNLPLAAQRFELVEILRKGK